MTILAPYGFQETQSDDWVRKYSIYFLQLTNLVGFTVDNGTAMGLFFYGNDL